MAPREIEDGTDIDRDTDTDVFEDVPYEKLMAMLQDDSAPGDDEAFGKADSTPAPEAETVSIEDGLDLIEKAQTTKREASKVEAKDEPAPDAEAKTDDQPPVQEDTAPPADDLDTLLTGLPDTARDTIRSRVTAADEVLGLFKGREADLERFGTTPAKAMGELLKIEAYSRAKPDEYLAWAAAQFGDPAEMLGKAAERHGFKLVAATGVDDDPFEDPDIKAIREENRRLKAQISQPQIGPDAPQNRVQDELTAFQKGATHFQAVAPQIAALAQAHVQTTGKPATIADIKRFYDAAVMVTGLQPAPATDTPAAQAQLPVQQQPQTTAAPSDSVKRAMAASRSLDGSGQGAGRRPAIAPDASLESVLTSLLAAQTKG